MKRIILILVLLTSRISGAAEVYEFYNAVRPLGMGGAGLATVNDETALLMNASALGKLRDTFTTVVDPELAGNFDVLRLSGANVPKMSQPRDAFDRLNKHRNTHYHDRAQVFPSIVTRGFGLGAFARQSTDAEVFNDGTMLYNQRTDVAGVVGFNVRTAGGLIKIGTTARAIKRMDIQRKDINPATESLDRDKLALSGTGLGVDASLMLTAPVDYLPSFTLVWRDVGQTSFGLTSKDGADRPKFVDDTVDAGFAIYPILGRDVRTTWTIQYDDLTGDAKDPLRHLHAGFEYNYFDSVFFRLGLNQRYWTAGLELAYVGYQFQLASYGEEIGTASTPREDRRGVAKFSFRF